METRSAVLCVTALTSLLATASESAAAAVVPDSSGAEVGLTRIECVSEHGADTRRFRGAVIDTGTAAISYEVVLTAGHGLPSDVDALRRACSVVGAEDRRYLIEDVWRPSSRSRGAADDWAVLVTERRLRGDVKRLRTLTTERAFRQQLAENELPVRLPLRFIGAERACHLVQPGLSGAGLAVELFGHTCRAWSGHSGSPILTAVEDEMYILGIHLGSRWSFEERASLRIGRFLDAEMLEAIHGGHQRACSRRRSSHGRDRPDRRYGGCQTGP